MSLALAIVSLRNWSFENNGMLFIELIPSRTHIILIDKNSWVEHAIEDGMFFSAEEMHRDGH